MNNKFKRVLSSLLAFVMLLSCVTVMNVSSVWAADGDTYTVSGTVSLELAAANDTVVIADATNHITYTGAISANGSYTVTGVPAGTYGVGLNSATYKALRKNMTAESTSVTVTAADVIHNIELNDSVITNWNFDNGDGKYYISGVHNSKALYSYHTIQGSTGLLKGLYIDATGSSCKFAPRAKDAQVNNGTVVYVPMDTKFDKVSQVEYNGQGAFEDKGVVEKATLSNASLTSPYYRKLVMNAPPSGGYTNGLSVEKATMINVTVTVTGDDGVT